MPACKKHCEIIFDWFGNFIERNRQKGLKTRSINIVVILVDNELIAIVKAEILEKSPIWRIRLVKDKLVSFK